MNEEITEVESVPEEEPTSMEVGFDICGTDLKPELSVDQGKPPDAFKPSLCFEKLYFTLLMLCCIR
jgi:hypothetical protein